MLVVGTDAAIAADVKQSGSAFHVLKGRQSTAKMLPLNKAGKESSFKALDAPKQFSLDGARPSKTTNIISKSNSAIKKPTIKKVEKPLPVTPLKAKKAKGSSKNSSDVDASFARVMEKISADLSHTKPVIEQGRRDVEKQGSADALASLIEEKDTIFATPVMKPKQKPVDSASKSADEKDMKSVSKNDAVKLAMKKADQKTAPSRRIDHEDWSKIIDDDNTPAYRVSHTNFPSSRGRSIAQPMGYMGASPREMGMKTYRAKPVKVKKTAKKVKSGSFFSRLFGFVPGHQPNGRNDASIYSEHRGDGEWIWPVAFTQGQRISSPYGHRRHPVTGRRSFHKGVDIAAPRGTKVMAASDGVVDKVTRHRHLGKYVRIKHDDGYLAYYGHLSKWNVSEGERVRAGEVIGRIGSTGRSTGPHLDFSVRKLDNKAIDPMQFLDVPAHINVSALKKRKTSKRSGS